MRLPTSVIGCGSLSVCGLSVTVTRRGSRRDRSIRSATFRCGKADDCQWSAGPPPSLGRGHRTDHHAVALALGPVENEAFALVHPAGALVDERRVLLPDPASVMRIAFD